MKSQKGTMPLRRQVTKFHKVLKFHAIILVELCDFVAWWQKKTFRGLLNALKLILLLSINSSNHQLLQRQKSHILHDFGNNIPKPFNFFGRNCFD